MLSALSDTFHMAMASFFALIAIMAQSPSSPVQAPVATSSHSTAEHVQIPSPTASVSTASMMTPSAHIKWGAFAGYDESAIKEFESKVGENMDHVATFVGWTDKDTFPSHLASSATEKTLIIFWEPDDSTQPPFSYDPILSGDRDSYIKNFAADAKAYGGLVILIPFSEMNGEWSSWSGTENGNTPEKFVQAFKRIRGFFEGVPNVQIGWGPNAKSVPDTKANAVEKYYPGDAYVDVVGVDGFNFGNPWETFDQIFGAALVHVSQYEKPIYIFSFATAEGPKKAAWITDALTEQIPKYPLIAGWVWFNEDKEADWRVWSDAASLAAFQRAVQ